MRRLIYIPIIHTDADMGSLASALDQSTAAFSGEERWERHKATASHFWQMVSDYLEMLDTSNLKVYQDGFVSDGDLGKNIIEEAVRRGSQNYEVILNLLDRGAEVISTEDIALLQKEYENISRIIKAETPSQRRSAYKEYESRKSQLTMERDSFIARTVNETLEDSEVGLLFIGAYHDVVPHLAQDIVVEQLKEREKVKAYFDELMYGNDERNFERLTRYISSAVGAGVS
jgi:hypothetical protein